MDNAILQYFQDKRRKEKRERAEKARERTQRSEKVKSLKEEIARKPLALMTKLSPAAQTVWEAFNEDEVGVFVDYGDKLAAALRAAADQVVPPNGSRKNNEIRSELLAIADEFKDQ
jgi:O6-methylguanine-DNA--protein-cysteine methyltransferase